MKAACILVIRCGAGCASATTLRVTLQSALEGRYEVKELILPGSIGDEEGHLVMLAIRRDKPRILIFCHRGDRAIGEVNNLLKLGLRTGWDMPVLVAVPVQQPEELLEIVKLGVSDFITLPLRKEEVVARLWLLDPGAANDHPAFAQLYAKHGMERIIGESPAFVAALQQLPDIAKCDASVLLKGETGTGKELAARAIHYLSPRSSKPFVPVNCGAIPVDLTENEFFGHEAGAFTSANTARRGAIHEAEGGTLFLDEIDCLPLVAQVKFLRLLQDGHFRPLGSERVCQANVRVIAASNIDFAEVLESGRFRKDLYYRLNVLSVSLPPLRERADDILLLARHFLSKYAQKFAAPARDFSPSARMYLNSYEWPGNVRELENVVARSVALAKHALIQPNDLRLKEAASPAPQASFRELKAAAMAQFERDYLHQVLLAHDGNITKAAASAHKDRRAFWELMRKHRISAHPQFSTAR